MPTVVRERAKPALTPKPSKYSLAERIIRIVQWFNIIISALAAIANFTLALLGTADGSRGGALLGFVSGVLIAAVILVGGALIWALLEGVLALFDIAKGTADNKRILLKIAQRGGNALTDQGGPPNGG